MINLSVDTHRGVQQQVQIDQYPDWCPWCHAHVDPHRIAAYLVNPVRSSCGTVITVFRCPKNDCQRPFLAIFRHANPASHSSNYYVLGGYVPRNTQPAVFAGEVEKVSPEFVRIYNQALTAETQGLDQVCGPGYRKALEFLIKDYLISKDPDAAEKIKDTQLGNLINDRVDEVRLKSSAKRAAWLGNDETHYLRKWEDKDLSDLKRLIALTVNWIHSDLLLEGYEADMP